MLIRTIATHVGAFLALIIALIFASDVAKLLKNPTNSIIVILAFLVTIGLGVLDIKSAAANRPRQFKGKRRDAKVRKFMIGMLAGDGRCVVSSNDLSWVEETALDALMRKAEKRSLELIMPSETTLSTQLVGAGAEAHYYGDSDFKFRSRFTIVNVNRADAWVAVGMGTSKAHVIRIISSNDDPVYHMATDLVELAERAAKVATP